MGLFDRFPSLYSQQQAEPLQGPRAIPALTQQAAPTMPKKRGLFARFGEENAKGYSGWDGLQIAGATLRDIGNPNGQNVAALQEMMAAQQKAGLAQQQKAALDQMASQIITDPREALLYRADPKSWAEANKSRIEAFTLKNTRYAPDGSIIASAPDYVTMGDQLVQTGPQGAQSIFTRGPTIAEAETAQEHDWRRQFDTKGFDWLKQFQTGTLGVQRGQLGVAQAAHRARMEHGGYGTPGVGAVGAFDPNTIKWD